MIKSCFAVGKMQTLKTSVCKPNRNCHFGNLITKRDIIVNIFQTKEGDKLYLRMWLRNMLLTT